jgi:hypothetical protein
MRGLIYRLFDWITVSKLPEEILAIVRVTWHKDGRADEVDRSRSEAGRMRRARMQPSLPSSASGCWEVHYDYCLTTFAQPSALANITGFSEWSEAVERLEQSSIQEAFSTVGIPADSLPNYSTPQDFAKGFRRCSILEYKQVSYSSSTSPQEPIPSTLKR